MDIKLPYNSDCIIYNDYSSGSTRQAIKHVLPNVWWGTKEGVNSIKGGVTTSNSVDIALTKREGYRAPEEWQRLTPDEASSGKYYTLQTGDRVIKGNATDTPATFASLVEVDKFFGAQNTHMIMSVSENILPGGKTHHFEMRCS